MLDLGRFGRAPIMLHPTFFLAAFVLTFHFWRLPGGTGPLLVLLGALVLLGSILLHELAHAEVGRRFGVAARWIDINLFGGIVHFMTTPRLMRHDFAITIAGPLTNAAVALLTFLLLALVRYVSPEQFVFGFGYAEQSPTGMVVRLARFACFLNVGLAIANMLPAFPLDGGRLLYMLVADRFDRRTATLVVGRSRNLCCWFRPWPAFRSGCRRHSWSIGTRYSWPAMEGRSGFKRPFLDIGLDIFQPYCGFVIDAGELLIGGRLGTRRVTHRPGEDGAAVLFLAGVLNDDGTDKVGLGLYDPKLWADSGAHDPAQ